MYLVTLMLIISYYSYKIEQRSISMNNFILVISIFIFIIGIYHFIKTIKDDDDSSFKKV